MSSEIKPASTATFSLLFGEREKDVCVRGVVGDEGAGVREELPVFPAFQHLRFEEINGLPVVFFRILLVKDAELFIG